MMVVGQAHAASSGSLNARFSDGRAVLDVEGDVSTRFVMNSGLPAVDPSGTYSSNQAAGYAVSNIRVNYAGKELKLLSNYYQHHGAVASSADAVSQEICNVLGKKIGHPLYKFIVTDYVRNATGSELVLMGKLRQAYPTATGRILSQAELASLGAEIAVVKAEMNRELAINYVEIYDNSTKKKAHDLYWDYGSQHNRVEEIESVVCLE